MEKKTLRIDVISDTVCPWCFIGKRRLEAALAATADRYEARVHWHPFQLDPELPPEGAEKKSHYARRFGSWERFLEMTERVAEVGREVGIDFDFVGSGRVPNTLDSHRLVWLAGDRQRAMVERLFRAHFVEGLDVGDRETLVRLAGEVGLDEAEVREALAGDAGRNEVRAALDSFRRMGVSGVPFFIVNGRYAVSGAHPAETLVELFERAAADGADD